MAATSSEDIETLRDVAGVDETTAQNLLDATDGNLAAAVALHFDHGDGVRPSFAASSYNLLDDLPSDLEDLAAEHDFSRDSDDTSDDTSHDDEPLMARRAPTGRSAPLLSLLGFLGSLPGLPLIRALAVGIGRFLRTTGLLDLLGLVGSTLLLTPLRLLGFLPPAHSALATAESFQAEFESVYGETHPVICRGSCAMALQRAKREGKFVLAYVHAAGHPDTPGFLSAVISSALFAAMVDERFIFFVADVASPDGRAVRRAAHLSEPPALALLSGHRDGAAHLLGSVAGVGLSDDEAVTRLIAMAAPWEHLLEESRTEARERQNSRLIREEQESEYARALAEDQAREEAERAAAEHEERQIAEAAAAVEREARREREEVEALEQRAAARRAKAAILPAEPEDGTRVVVKLPDGQRLNRRFDKTCALQVVVDWIESESPDIYGFDLVSNYPRKLLTADVRGKTLEELGLHPASTLFTKEQEEALDGED